MKSEAIFQIPEENVEETRSATNIPSHTSQRIFPLNSPRKQENQRKLNVFSSASGRRQSESEIVVRMLEFMKEQINISNKKARSMFQKPLREQALQIVELKQLLGQNEKQLRQKETTIKQLVAKLKTIFNSDPSLIAQNCLARVTAVQGEAKKLKKMLVGLESYQITINKKIAEVESIDSSKLAELINKSEQQLKSLIHEQRNKLQQLQKNLQSLRQAKQSNFPQLDFPACMSTLKAKLAEIYSELQFQSQRSYEYDNYQIPLIVTMLAKLQSDLGLLPVQQRHSLDMDSSTVSFNEEGGSESESSYDRFRSMARKMRLKLPLPVEIDQTGYMKSIETGMYIADENGDYFQLSEQEIEQFVSQGLVWL